jgi:hypothetical protein
VSALSPASQENYLRALFTWLELLIGKLNNISDLEGVQPKVFGFADYLFDNFLLSSKPCK